MAERDVLTDRGALVLATCFPRRIPDSVVPFMLYHAKGLARIYRDVTVVVPHSDEADPSRERDRERHGNVEIRRFTYFFRNRWQRLCYRNGIPNNLGTYPVAWMQIPFFLAAALLGAVGVRKRVDIVYCHWTPTVLVGVIMKLFGKKVVAVLHGSDIRLLPERLNRFLLNRTDAVITGHEEMFDYVSERIRPRVPVRLVRNFFDDEAFVETRNPLNKKILYLGRLDPHRQPMAFLEVARRLHLAGSSLRFTMIGDGLLRPQVEEFLGRENLPNVVFLGPRDDVPEILKEHTACLFLSKVENIWITTLIETIRANRLCILNTVGKTADVFTDGENALLCDSLDEAVEKLLLVERGSVDVAGLSRNALRLIKEHGFDSETVAAAHVELVSHLR